MWRRAPNDRGVRSITLANLGEITAAGVDIVSLGWLTHSAPILDIALDVEPLTAAGRTEPTEQTPAQP